MRKEYNKLVRDRIPEIIQTDGRQYEVKVVSSEEYTQLLKAKLVEEAQEVATADDDEIIKELADLYEVIDSLISAKGIENTLIRIKQQERRLSRGGFEKRLCLLWTE